jgi:ABC-type sugar transport system permease subunit
VEGHVRERAEGTINRALNALCGLIGSSFAPVDWLGDPATVMACVILPGVWASAGIGSLIYLPRSNPYLTNSTKPPRSMAPA